MPYVNRQHREEWDAQFHLKEYPIFIHESAIGDINYFVTTLLLAWLGPNPRYGDYNAAIGVLECIKLELYRRAVAPYEDKKCEENGDVY